MAKRYASVRRKVDSVIHETSITGRDRWIETLSCGHRNSVYGKEKPKAKTRNCYHLDCVKEDECQSS